MEAKRSMKDVWDMVLDELGTCLFQQEVTPTTIDQESSTQTIQLQEKVQGVMKE
jgi:hypothetical protein